MESTTVQALGAFLVIVGLTFVSRSVPIRPAGTPGHQLLGHVQTADTAVKQNAQQIRNGGMGLGFAVSGLTLQLVSLWM